MRIEQQEAVIPEHRAVKTWYVADDGMRFEFKSECEKYEKGIAIEASPVRKSCVRNVQDFKSGEYCDIYYLRSQEDYNFLLYMLDVRPELCEGDKFGDCGEGWYLFHQRAVRAMRCVYNIRYLDKYIAQLDREWMKWKDDVRKRIEAKEEGLKDAERGNSES